jgi:hypothetical protein
VVGGGSEDACYIASNAWFLSYADNHIFRSSGVQEFRSSGVTGVQEFSDRFHLRIGHCLMAGEAELLLVDQLGDGQGEVVPLLVASLLVGRYGVVNHRHDALLLEVLLEGIAMRGEDGVDVIDAVGKRGVRSEE